MALTTTSIKQLTAWLRTAPTNAAEYIVNLVSQVQSSTGVQRFGVFHSADAAASTATAEKVFGVARVAGSTGTAGLDLSFSANVTADNTNYATIIIRRRTGAGAGTAAVIATVTTEITGLGNVTGFARLTPTTSNVAIIAGDRFTYEVTKAGTGVQLPAFHAAVVETVT